VKTPALLQNTAGERKFRFSQTIAMDAVGVEAGTQLLGHELLGVERRPQVV
jgi:hypothetical protein